MKTIAARYGYLNGGDPETWGADAWSTRRRTCCSTCEALGTLRCALEIR